MENKQYRNGEQDRRLEWLETHYSNFNQELGDIKVDLAKVKTDVCWLKRYFWIVITASIGALITGLINIIQ